MTTVTAPSLADAALERIAAATAGREPGQPYLLSREAFSRFWREELCDDFASGADHCSRIDLWVAIATAEARRQFDPGWNLCHSDLFFSTEDSGACEWWYQTTSGTELFALDWRNSEPQGRIYFDDVITALEGVLPWSPESRDLENPWAPIGSDGFYAVTIPAERDQPGRTAWTQIRLAISGLDYRCWAQENGDDEIGAARAAVRATLSLHA